MNNRYYAMANMYIAQTCPAAGGETVLQSRCVLGCINVQIDVFHRKANDGRRRK